MSFVSQDPLTDYRQKKGSEVVQSSDAFRNEFEVRGGTDGAHLKNLAIQPSTSAQTEQSATDWFQRFLNDEESNYTGNFWGQTDVSKAQGPYNNVSSVDQAESRATNNLGVSPHYDPLGSTTFYTESPSVSDASDKQSFVQTSPEVQEGDSIHGPLWTQQYNVPAPAFDQTSAPGAGGNNPSATIQLRKEEQYGITTATSSAQYSVPRSGGPSFNNENLSDNLCPSLDEVPRPQFPYAPSNCAVPPAANVPGADYTAPQQQTFAQELPQFVQGNLSYGASSNPHYLNSSRSHPTPMVGWPGASSSIPPVQLGSTVDFPATPDRLHMPTWDGFSPAPPSIPQHAFPQPSFPQHAFPQYPFPQNSFLQPLHTLPPYSPLPAHPSPSNKRRERENDGVSSQRKQKASRRTHSPSAEQTGTAFAQETRRRHPAPYRLEKGYYICTYTGPTTNFLSTKECGRISSSRDLRARDRHLATHAAKEEELIAANVITRDQAVALEWVSRIVVTCDKPGCNFTTAVWRTDNVRRNHCIEAHPEDVPPVRTRPRIKAISSSTAEPFQ